MSHPVDVFVGKKLRLRRKLLGLSQEVVANAVGVTFQQVQKYERGVNRISASRLSEFAEALKVPILYFFEGMNQNDEYTTGTSSARTALAEQAAVYEVDAFSQPETVELLKHFYRCSPPVRKKITEMIKAMASDKATID
jgi:transcriptional regulator with XRE-family HTH domain